MFNILPNGGCNNIGCRPSALLEASLGECNDDDIVAEGKRKVYGTVNGNEQMSKTEVVVPNTKKGAQRTETVKCASKRNQLDGVTNTPTDGAHAPRQ